MILHYSKYPNRMLRNFAFFSTVWLYECRDNTVRSHLPYNGCGKKNRHQFSILFDRNPCVNSIIKIWSLALEGNPTDPTPPPTDYCYTTALLCPASKAICASGCINASLKNSPTQVFIAKQKNISLFFCNVAFTEKFYWMEDTWNPLTKNS